VTGLTGAFPLSYETINVHITDIRLPVFCNTELVD
jgi:hypothetical protein